MLDLKNARDRLNKYKKKLEQDEAKLVDRAREAKQAGQTKTALNLLRLRKYKQNEVDTVEGQLLTVLQLVSTIDSKQNEKEVLAAMKTGKDTLQKMHEEITVDHVLELMDSIQEEHALEKEISDLIAEGGELSLADEASVEAELEALMKPAQQQSDQETTLPVAPDTKLPHHLPVAPDTKLPTTATAQTEKRVAVPS